MLVSVSDTRLVFVGSGATRYPTVLTILGGLIGLGFVASVGPPGMPDTAATVSQVELFLPQSIKLKLDDLDMITTLI